MAGSVQPETIFDGMVCALLAVEVQKQVRLEKSVGASVTRRIRFLNAIETRRRCRGFLRA
jgi:hypothetical protein